MQPEGIRRINAEELYREVKKKWVSIYPAYFDSTKSIAEGTLTAALRKTDQQKSMYRKAYAGGGHEGSQHPNDQEHLRAR